MPEKQPFFGKLVVLQYWLQKYRREERCLCMPHQFRWLLLAFPLSQILFWRGLAGCSNAWEKKMWMHKRKQDAKNLEISACRRSDTSLQLQGGQEGGTQQPSCRPSLAVKLALSFHRSEEEEGEKPATLGRALQRPSAGRECHLVPPAVTCVLHTARRRERFASNPRFCSVLLFAHSLRERQHPCSFRLLVWRIQFYFPSL